MAVAISLPELTAYPGVSIQNADTAALILSLVNGLIGDIEIGGSTIGDLDPMPWRVKAIALEVAARALRNPDGAQSYTKGIDDWKETVRFIDPKTAGVFLTDAERDELAGFLNPGVTRAKSIRLGVPGYGANC